MEKDACNPSMINEIDEINEVLRSDMNISEDLPAPESTIQKNYSKPTVLESMQKQPKILLLLVILHHVMKLQIIKNSYSPNFPKMQFQNLLRDSLLCVTQNYFQLE